MSLGKMCAYQLKEAMPKFCTHTIVPWGVKPEDLPGPDPFVSS